MSFAFDPPGHTGGGSSSESIGTEDVGVDAVLIDFLYRSAVEPGLAVRTVILWADLSANPNTMPSKFASLMRLRVFF